MAKRTTKIAKTTRPLTTETAVTRLKKSALDALSENQRTYVELRVQGKSPEEAYRALGLYDKKSIQVDRYEDHPKIRLAIAEINRKAVKDLAITRNDVLEGLMDAVRASATSAELTAAWREIGRIIGAYEPIKVAVEHDVYTPESLRELTDAQLAQVASLQGVLMDANFTEAT